MFIKKFKLTAKFSEENEFETTKTRTTTTIMEAPTITDDYGNLLSASNVIKPKVKTKITEEISAVSLPSRTPAFVEILEIIEDNPESDEEETPKIINDQPKIMEGPIRQRPITLDQLQDGRNAKPLVLNNDGGPTMWV